VTVIVATSDIEQRLRGRATILVRFSHRQIRQASRADIVSSWRHTLASACDAHIVRCFLNENAKAPDVVTKKPNAVEIGVIGGAQGVSAPPHGQGLPAWPGNRLKWYRANHWRLPRPALAAACDAKQAGDMMMACPIFALIKPDESARATSHRRAGRLGQLDFEDKMYEIDRNPDSRVALIRYLIANKSVGEPLSKNADDGPIHLC
jgi:hypothetical protein